MQKVLIRPIHIESVPSSIPVDATAAITLAAGGEWLSETLDVLFGKRDVYPGAVILPIYQTSRPEMPLYGIASCLATSIDLPQCG